METIWKFLNGKKSAIGSTAGAVVTWALSKGWISPDDATLAAILLSVWTGIAVGHKAVKAKQLG
jgi:hypothetical protein